MCLPLDHNRHEHRVAGHKHSTCQFMTVNQSQTHAKSEYPSIASERLGACDRALPTLPVETRMPHFNPRPALAARSHMATVSALLIKYH